MKVHELRTVLDHLPDDLDVYMETGGGCCQIDKIDRRRANQRMTWPASLILRGRTVWCDPEVPWRLQGTFRDKADLIVKLLLGPPPKTRQRRST